MMNGKICILTNNITGKKYIGQTFQDVGVRIRQGYTPTSQIGAAIHAHGLENFTYEVCATAS